MILAFDVSYQETTAKSVCIAFHSWTDEKPMQTFIQHIDGVEEYQSGEFYKRELPCILKILDNIDLNLVETIIVDGYVILNDEGKYGLGGHLFESLHQRIPIVGVAKPILQTIAYTSGLFYEGKALNHFTSQPLE